MHILSEMIERSLLSFAKDEMISIDQLLRRRAAALLFRQDLIVESHPAESLQPGDAVGISELFDNLILRCGVE